MAVEKRAQPVSGWGRAMPTVAEVARPESVEEAVQALAAAGGRGALPRGLGRSYGDVAQNGGGLVLDMTALDEIRAFDPETGIVTTDAGCSLARVIERCAPQGWFPPVTPGTRFVTVGGAIACDVHGKNHHVEGAFGAHVLALTLLTPRGELRRLDPETTPDGFWATVGGLGLTGLIVEATFRLLRVAGSAIAATIERTGDLDATFARLAETDGDHRYSVAWIDAATTGRRLGRGVLMQGDHAESSKPLPAGRTLLAAPAWASAGPVLRGPAVRVLNELYFRRAPRRAERIVPLAPFFYPLDAVGEWNRVYGRGGFLQYQFAVPLDRHDVVRSALESLARAGVPSTLAVLKRLGPESAAPLSFPLPGWTLALDVALPAPAVAPVLDRLDEEVAAAGGRVYFAKDARLRGELLPVMYPRLEEWRAARADLDPDGVLQSDLARRVGLLR